HSVCFEKKGDLLPIAEEVAALGSKASLGCVRLSVEDAMWLYNAVPDGTLVTIAG
ncbi:MAG: L,D-transpeptidase family protein, partial [Lachnospiraceae bacterium]|nr:L,D-transpeptidase family protein [Lachnospiraceae bacterium]